MLGDPFHPFHVNPYDGVPQGLMEYHRRMQQTQAAQSNEHAHRIAKAFSLGASASSPSAEEKKEYAINKKLLLLLED